MLNISKISKKYGKEAKNFANMSDHRPRCISTKGRYSYSTQIPDDLIPEFLLWVSPEVRKMCVTIGWEKTLKHVLKEMGE